MAQDYDSYLYAQEDSAQYEQEQIPGYLADPPPALKTYGTLSYNAKTRLFSIKGDPAVCLMAKRLFPGCEGRTRDTVRFAANRRIIGDINWLMLRYPLDIAKKDRAFWYDCLDKAREFAAQRERALSFPMSAEPDSASFSGELRPFQKEGVGFLIQNDRALLADEMGLGKTVQALAFIAHEKLFPSIVVAPPHLTRNWLRETERFLRVNGREPVIHAIKGLSPYVLPKADIYIIHYLLLRAWKAALSKAGFACAVFDEIQELRHSGTEKYSAASLLSVTSKTAVGLSGTPIYNKGGEIWNVMNILDFHVLGDFESFSRQWCYGYGNFIVTKPEALGEHLKREGLILRRTKEQVLPQLPPKRRLVQEIDFAEGVYRRMMQKALPILAELLGADASRRAILFDRLSQADRQATGLAKAEYVSAFVDALLLAGEKALLFAHHHSVMDEYARLLKAHNPRFITGRESGAEKERAVEKFMSGETDLLCISLRAASGLNLQRATCVVFGELDWSPAVHSQAEDRAHRIGQNDSVLVYYLVAPDGSDRDVQDALGLKVSQFMALMGDRVKSQEETLTSGKQAMDYFDQILDRLTHKMNQRG